MALAIGEQVPDVTATTDDGRTVALSELAADGPLVVFFYPKAFTGGCTAEACHFRDLGAEFAELGATRVGVSRDDVATQARFAAEHGFDYPCSPTRTGRLAKAFGAKRPGPLMSKRQTFVVDTRPDAARRASAASWTWGSMPIGRSKRCGPSGLHADDGSPRRTAPPSPRCAR
jgi:thioredoxin-dependent peroxiredoxin